MQLSQNLKDFIYIFTFPNISNNGILKTIFTELFLKTICECFNFSTCNCRIKKKNSMKCLLGTCSCRGQICWISPFLLNWYFLWFVFILFICLLKFVCIYFNVNFTPITMFICIWIFGSPHPTVCKLVFFHSHLASGLQLWKFPLASMHLHFFVLKATMIAHAPSPQTSFTLAN